MASDMHIIGLTSALWISARGFRASPHAGRGCLQGYHPLLCPPPLTVHSVALSPGRGPPGLPTLHRNVWAMCRGPLRPHHGSRLSPRILPHFGLSAVLIPTRNWSPGFWSCPSHLVTRVWVLCACPSFHLPPGHVALCGHSATQGEFSSEAALLPVTHVSSAGTCGRGSSWPSPRPLGSARPRCT